MIPLSVFVVHSDASIASRIARAVAAAGHAPVLLGDGERAIDRFVQEPADVVVLDYFLPGRDGVATIESIRWAPGGKSAHVVLLADRETEPTPLAELGRRIGAIAALVGPNVEAAIADILEALGRPPPGESTRVASIGEIGDELDKLALSAGHATRSALDRGRIDARVTERDDDSTAPGEDEDGAAWPIIETVMAHASSSRVALPESASGIQRRPEGSRPTTPPPAMPAAEIFPARPEGESARGEDAPADDAEMFADADAMEEGRDVGEGARAAAEGSQRVMGRWDDTPFPALLRRLADLRTTGALVCTAEGTQRETTSGDPPTKIVYFRSGVPVHVRSNLVDECLGQILLRRRRIGVATLEESIRRMRLGEGLQGEILIDMGALAPLELGEALADQARDKLFDVFAWRRGTYRLSTKLEPRAGAVGIELGLAEILYEGVCASMPASRLLELLSPSLARFVVPDPVQLARFVRVRLVPEVRHVLARIDGTLALRDLLAMGSRPGAVAQLVYSMECLGAVRFADVPSRSSRSGEVPLASTSRELPVERLDEAVHEAAIDERGADVDETMSVADEETEPPPPGEGPPSVEAMLGADTSAAAARHANGAAPIDEQWDDPTAPLHERGRPAGVARNDSSGVTVTPEHDERRTTRESTPAPMSIDAAVDDAALQEGMLDQRVDRLFEAERQFRRGNRALDRGKLGEALGAFSKAYELCPDQGEFLAYVGWSRHCLAPEDEVSNDSALEELARARELAPELHVTHLLHARVLVSAGRVSEAHGAYLRVLQLDPTSVEARDAVASLRS
ncbi:MAG: DUF4388 domain-containing protein [Myxococcota bacterium]|nr:DUF4388 domain-containing protein [Myxococcota bacterium]